MPNDITKKAKTTNTTPDRDAEHQTLLEQNAALLKQVRELTSMLSLVHLQNAEPKDVPLYRVENAKGVAISFPVTDPKTGQVKTVSLERRNDFTKLYEEQIREIQEKYPHFFGDGYLVAPEIVADNPNAIPDIAEFLNSLEFDTIDASVSAITAVSTLFDIYHHIENLRYEYLDERGRPLTEKDHNDIERPVIREKKIDPKLLSVQMAVQSRILQLSGIDAKVS